MNFKFKLRYLLPEGLNKIFTRISSTRYRKRKIDHVYQKINYNRISLIMKSILLFPHETVKYLEIGCFNDDVFNSIPLNLTQKVGVDPQKGGTLRLTSDSFFKSNKDKFNVIFIDGLHTYDQVRRDILNSIQCLCDDGFIFIHDMLPESEISSKVPRQNFVSNWNGDVFKVIFDIIQNNNLEFKIVNIDFGIGIITKNNNNTIFLNENSYDYKYFMQNKHELPIISLEDSFKFLESKLKK